MLTYSRIIHERINKIPISNNLSTKMKEQDTLGEYSLNQNFFDPSKSSPPNEFMLKLKLRMSHYNLLDIKDDRRVNE
jgi:hypothetical protein